MFEGVLHEMVSWKRVMNLLRPVLRIRSIYQMSSDMLISYLQIVMNLCP